MRWVWREENGAGSILVVAILAAVLGLSALSIPLYSVLVAKNLAGGAADAAALAAADVAIGRAAGEPCPTAARIADANGTSLAACQPDGLVITVRVETVVHGFIVGAAASAGPPAGGL